MNNHEFIDFEYDNLNNVNSLRELYHAIKNSDINLVNEIVGKLPQYVKDFFNFSASQKDWNLVDLIDFLMQDLDVTYIDILLKDNNSAKLEYEANGYPYGGPDSLITLIKSFDCLPTKLDDGGGVFEIKWNSKINYDLIPLS